MFVLTANEIRQVEQLCFDNYSTEAELMLRAGTACYNQIINKYNVKNKNISVLCGNGKNAGDGFVIARLLYCYGANASIVLCDKAPTIAELLMYYNQAISTGVSVCNDFANADYIVDTMFGIGFHGQARAPFDKIFEQVNSSSATVIAVDTPSGANATTGEVCDNCINADFTIAISTLKMCHILPPANAYCGETVVVNIGIPDDCYTGNYVNTIDLSDIKNILPKQNKNSNKGSNGHLLNICGSYNMFGAAVIATKSAIRSGAGLVKLDVPSTAYPLVANHLTQCIFNPVDSNADGTFSSFASNVAVNDLSWANAVVIGCGMGCNADTVNLTQNVIKNAKSPIIIDADGINSLKQCISIVKDVKVPVVLTPHPGEMARLTSCTVADVQSDRIGIAKRVAKQYNAIVVLKGANTVVTDGDRVFVNLIGNPAMAMGGTGDMLSGIIGSFVAQGANPFDAAKAGVYIHALCGDKATEAYSRRGITVDDMIDQLCTLMSLFD